MGSLQPYFDTREWRSPNGDRQRAWFVRWPVGGRLNGRQRYRERGGFARRQDAEAYYRRHVVPALDAGYAHPDDMAAEKGRQEREQREAQITIGQWVEAHLKSCTHLSRHALESKSSVLRCALRHLGEHNALAEINEEMLISYINSDRAVRSGGAPSKDTKANRHRILWGLFQDAAVKGRVAANPMSFLKAPRPSRGRLRFLSESEIECLLSTCLRHQSRHLAETSASSLERWVKLAIYGGFRDGELRHLEYTDADAALRRLRIQKKPKWDWEPKWGRDRSIGVNDDVFVLLVEQKRDLAVRLETAKERLASLETWAATPLTERHGMESPELLRRYERPPSISKLIQDARGVVASLELQMNSSLVFPGPTGEPMTEPPKAFEHAVKRAGLANVSMHVLRHTYASLAIANGVSLNALMILLGHSDIDTTMRYAHLCPDHAASQGARIPTLRSVSPTSEGASSDIVGDGARRPD